MINLEHLHQQTEELERLLRLQSFPVGIKLIGSEKEIPEGAQRPLRDMKRHLSFCQAIALARRYGMMITETKEDMWCFEPVIGLGFEEPPQRFLEGYGCYPCDTDSEQAAATWARGFPRLDHGRQSAVVMAPLAKANFKPDLFLLYGDPAKMHAILSARIWLDGRDITTTMSGNAACVYAVAPVVKDKGWHFTIPCGGDSTKAACDLSDMIFSAPMEELDRLLKGLRATHEGEGIPRRFTMAMEYPTPEPYCEIARLIGMDWIK